MTETGLKNLIDELALKDVKDVEVLKILDIPSYLKIFNLNFPSSKKAILDKLCEEKIIQKSKNSSYHITNLGAILFAEDLNVFENLSRKAIRIGCKCLDSPGFQYQRRRTYDRNIQRSNRN